MDDLVWILWFYGDSEGIFRTEEGARRALAILQTNNPGYAHAYSVRSERIYD